MPENRGWNWRRHRRSAARTACEIRFRPWGRVDHRGGGWRDSPEAEAQYIALSLNFALPPLHNLNSQLVYSDASASKAARAAGFAADLRRLVQRPLNDVGNADYKTVHAFSHSLERERAVRLTTMASSPIHRLSHLGHCDEFFGPSSGNNPALGDDVAPIGNTQRALRIWFGYEYSDALLSRVVDD